MKCRKIAWNHERCFGKSQVFADSIKNFISHEIKFVVMAQKLPSNKPFLTLKLSQCFWPSKLAQTKSVSSSEPAAASSNCRWLGNILCLCLTVRPAPSDHPRPQAVPKRCPKRSAILGSGISSRSDCQMTCRGSNLDSNLNPTALPTTSKGFICSYCVEFEFF